MSRSISGLLWCQVTGETFFMPSIVHREMSPGEVRAVCELATQVSNQYAASDDEQAGIEAFFRFANPGALKERMQSDGFVLVAQQRDQRVGMLEFLSA